MLNKIIHFSLQNRILVLVASVLLLIGGTYTAMHTEVDVFPDLNAPTVVIMTEANGMAAEEVEQLVTFPVETAVNGATGVRRVRSSSTNGFSVVWVEFDWETDVYLARQIVSEKLAVVSESLPSNVGKPTLGPQSSILGEMLIVGLTADSTSMLDLRTIADWTIRPRLLSTGGVAQVAVLGGDIKEYQIQLDPERMRHYGVTLTEVMNVTREMNLNANGGVLYEYGNEYIVRGVISTDRVEQLAKAVVNVMLPSNYGGDALANLLAGDANFSGKMPFTYPKYINALANYDYKPCENMGQMGGNYNYDSVMDVQWEFGFGLSYTTYSYSNLKVDKTSFTADDVLTVSVDVTNTGKVAGKESVLLYSKDLVASSTPDNIRLRNFEKIELNPGETKTVTMQLKGSDLAFVGYDGKWRLEKGDFKLKCGNQWTDIQCSETKVWDTPNK